MNINPNQQQQPMQNAQGTAQQEDYLDKALDAAEKKFGGPSMQDTQQHRAVNEKIVCCVPTTFAFFNPNEQLLMLIDARPMARATCLKKQRANTSRKSSQTSVETQASDLSERSTRSRHSTLKEKLHVLSDKWDRCRPYMERINGTIVPLEARKMEKKYLESQGMADEEAG